MTPLLHAQNLTFAYAGEDVVRNVAVDLNAGQVVMLLGPNGSGKSTLIKLLLGILRGQGKISWENRDIESWNRRELAKRIAYLPQSPAWDPNQTVHDALRLGRAPYWAAFGIESARDASVVTEIAALLNLNEVLNRRMDEISGGQRQRVFIARCLVQEPTAMLLDEPNTFLDLHHQVELGLLLRKLAKEKKIGVLMASHDLNLAGAFADQMVLLSEGRMVKNGSAREVMNPDVLSAVYGVKMERIESESGSVVVTPLVQPIHSRL